MASGVKFTVYHFGLSRNGCFLLCLPRKNLCPALIVILGNPIHDKTITSAHSSSAGAGIESDSASPGVSDHGRGSGCSSTAPALSGPVARTIYYIAAELVRLVGSVDSMKPVLQSLYHRVLLYPPPQHRVEAIKIMKEVRRPRRTPPRWPDGGRRYLHVVSYTQKALGKCLPGTCSNLLVTTWYPVTGSVFRTGACIHVLGARGRRGRWVLTDAKPFITQAARI